jgi:hypothetical protein
METTDSDGKGTLIGGWTSTTPIPLQSELFLLRTSSTV